MIMDSLSTAFELMINIAALSEAIVQLKVVALLVDVIPFRPSFCGDGEHLDGPGVQNPLSQSYDCFVQLP